MVQVARLYRLDNPSGLKAFADAVVDEQLLVKGIKVFKDRDGNEFIKMPSQQARNGKWYETVSVVGEELKQELEQVVLKAFNMS